MDPLATWEKLLIGVIGLLALLWFFPGGQNDDRAESRCTKRLARRTHPRSRGRHFCYSFT